MPETIYLSNYELLVRPIIDSMNSPNRTVIQGYFVTIANPNLSNLEIDLTFRATSPDFASANLVAFWDVNGANVVVPPMVFGTETARYRFNLPATDTGLFLLLPDVTDPSVIPAQDTEIRGYVRLSIPSATPLQSNNTRNRRLLLSVQQRGTFLPQGATNPPEVGDYDQFSYSLPTATGGSEVIVQARTLVDSFQLPDSLRDLILNAIETDPSLISAITSDPFIESISELTPDEQREMLKIFLERFEATSSQASPELASVN